MENKNYSELKNYEKGVNFQKAREELCNALISLQLCDNDEETERASQFLLKKLIAVHSDCFRRLYGWYGAAEFTYKMISEEQMHTIIDRELLKRAMKFDFSAEFNDDIHFVRQFYGHCRFAYHESKRFIEREHGVSHHYVEYLMHIKKAGLDLFTSPDDELELVLARGLASRSCKRPDKLLAKMRSKFTNQHLEEVA